MELIDFDERMGDWHGDVVTGFLFFMLQWTWGWGVSMQGYTEPYSVIGSLDGSIC